ncbi:hypothetical protein D3C76_639590 [compost metagenome]
MNLTIVSAEMKKDGDGAFIGRTIFRVESHTADYEITFFSKNGKDWDYSLNYALESGVEEQFQQVDEAIEQSDDLFDDLLDAAVDAYPE